MTKGKKGKMPKKRTGPSAGHLQVMASMTPAGRLAYEAAGLFQGSRDFFLAYQILGAQRLMPAVRASRAPWPMQAHASCAAFALELALKCRVTIDGKPAGKTHSYVDLFERLSPAAQTDVVHGALINAVPATPADFVEILDGMEGTFEAWRYLHEGSGIAFDEPNISAIVQALHESIIRARPDLKSWAGVISD